MKILEREPFLRDLRAWLEDAAAGRGRMAFVAGEAGIGKTVLVRLFVQAVEGLARVAMGQCDPLSTPRVLGPLVDAADVIGREIGRLIDVGAPQTRLFHGTLAALAADRRPTILVLEDVHWADEGTLDLLRFLGRRIASVRAMVMATYREDEVGPNHPLTTVLGDLATAEGVRRLSVPPLTAASVEVLARGSDLDPRELHRLTGGNPFFVTECLAARTQAVPVTVRDAVLARSARLSPAARRVLDAAAVIGSPAELDILRGVAGEDYPAVAEVLSSGMLRGGDQAVSFRHELARRAVLDALTPERAGEVHRGVLRALLDHSRADPARRAHHAEAAGDRAMTVRYAAEAGRRASQLGAHREATAQYARALRAAQAVTAAARADLLEAFAEESGMVDHVGDTLSALDEAIAIRRNARDGLREAVDLTRRSVYAIRAGRNDEGEENIQAAFDLLAAHPPGAELARAYRAYAYMRMLNRDNAEAVAWAERAIRLAHDVNDVTTLVGAHNALGSALILSGDTARGVEHLEHSRRMAEDAGLTHDAAVAYVNLGSASGEVFQLAQADRYFREGLAYCIDHDIDQSRYYLLAWRALSHLYQGRWDEAERDARSVVGVAHASVISRITALIALGRVLTRRGDPAARAALDEALALTGRTATLQRVAPVRAARAEAAWLGGDHARAAEEASPGYELAAKHRHPWFGGELAYWLWTTGGLETVPEWLAEPHALQLAGRSEDAAAAWERLGCPFEQARALSHSSDEDALRRAHRIFDHLGARPMATLVARRLRAAGVRNIPRGPRPATRTHPSGLTPREVEIVTLLADGLRNPEIARRLYLSAKTVDHHVSSILAKLGVRSRAEVVREAVRLGLLDAPARTNQHGSTWG
jgi:DNA-binding CsgD family transcriptional regulator/tetratricopeptide (TPR) repeat protein